MKILAVRAALLGLALFPWNAAGETTAAAFAGPKVFATPPRLVTERTNGNHTTWDLGPDPDQPGKHRYAVAIRRADAAPVITLPAPGGGEPVSWQLSDGRKIAWSFISGAPMNLAQQPPVNERLPDPAPFTAPKNGGAVRAEGDGHHFLLRLPRGGLATRLRLDAGLTATADEHPQQPSGKTGMSGRISVRDGGGSEVLVFAFISSEVKLTFAPVVGDPQAYDLHVSGRNGPALINAWVTPSGDYGGWQCNTGSGGTAGNSNPSSAVYVGEYPLGGNPRYTCNGYIKWDVSSALPGGATPTGVWLYPLTTSGKFGAGNLNVRVKDVRNTTPIPYPAFYNGAIWDDFNTMESGHPEYGTVSVDLGGGTTASNCTYPGATADEYCLELGHQGLMDAINRLRGGSFGYLAAAFQADPVAAGNYLTFASGSSILYIYYTDYVPLQLAINHLQPDWGPFNQKAVIELYNYDDYLDLSGWQLRSAGWYGLEIFTLPAGAGIARHRRLLIIDDAGANTGDLIYTGGNRFHWGKNLAPYDVQLSLLRPDASAVDYVCWGGAAPTPPAGTGWSGACLGPLFNTTTMQRRRDSDSDSGDDWSFDYVDMTQTLMPGQTGTRRRSDVFINEIRVFGPGGYNWLELANYGPPINLQGWSVEIYSGQSAYGTLDGTYSFPANPVQSSEVVWLAEGNSYFGGGGNPPVDNLHRNLGFTVNWNQNPFAGEIILRDAGGRARDYAVFGKPRQLHLPAEIGWSGPFIDLGTSTTPDVARAADLNTNSAGEWVQRPDLSNWGALTPTQQGAGRVQDEIGGDYLQFNQSVSGTDPFGAGAAVSVTRQVGLEEFAITGSPVSGPRNGILVVKRQGDGSVYFSRNVTVNDAGRSTIRSGLISPPLVLDPGLYAFMLYLDGDWRTDQDFYETERLSFGAFAGLVIEEGFVPSPSFVTPSGFDSFWAAHTYLSTVNPPAISSALNPPAGEESVAYTFAHTSSGGYGSSRVWSLVSGTLPAGVTLAANGALSGTPTQDGTYTFTIRVTDGAGLYNQRSETLLISPRLEVATSVLPYYDRALAPYNFTLEEYGGVAPFTWSCPVLPAGLSCSAAGWLSGTTTVASGDHPVNVTVTDSHGVIASKSLTLKVYNLPAILTSTLANGYLGIDYGTQRLSGAGGSGAGVWSVTGGGLPAGLTLSGNAITGTPTTAGSFPVTITYTVGAESDSRGYTINISKATVPPYWIRRGLAGGDIGQLYFSPNFALDGTVIALSGDRGALYISQDGGFYWRFMKLTLEPAFDDNQVYDNYVNDVEFAPGFDGRPEGIIHTIAVASSINGLLVSDDLDVTWTQRNTGLDADPYPGVFTNVKSVNFDPGSPAVFVVAHNIAAGKSILYKSGTGVDNWTPLANNGLSGAGLDKVYMSPNFSVDRTFFAPVGHVGLYRTLDGGANWQTLGSLLSTNDAPSFEISPNYATDHTLAMTLTPNGVAGAIYVSHDNGASFNPRGGTFAIRSFHFPANYHAATNPRLYASGDTTGGLQMMGSGDNGFTFSPTGTGGLPPPNFSGNFYLSPAFAADQTIFALGSNGVGISRSQDGGSLWGPSDNGIYFQNINSAAIAPNYAASGKAFVGTDNGVYYTVNRGKVWQPATYVAPLPSTMRIKAIAVSPAFSTDNRLFAFACGPASCQVIGSSNGGQSFSALAPAGSEIYDPGQFQVSPNFAADSRLFYTGYNGALSIFSFYLSNNAGVSFTAQNTATVRGAGSYGVSPGYASDASVYLNDYVSASQSYVNRISTNGGVNFSTFTAPTGNFGAVFTRTYNRLTGIDGTHSRTFFWNCQKTVNAGVSFTALPMDGCGDVYVSPNYQFDNTLFVFHPDYLNWLNNGLYKSIDGGATFTRLSAFGNPLFFAGITQVAISPNYSADQTLMVATAYGLYISTDGGMNFDLSSGTEGISEEVTAVAQDPNTPGRLYIGTADVGMLRSNDDGLTATDISTGLPPYALINGLLAVGNPTVLLAALNSGVYRFTEAAGDWTLVSTSPNEGYYQEFTTDAAAIYASRSEGPSISSSLGAPNEQLGVTWTALGGEVTDSQSLDYNGSMALTLGPQNAIKGLAPAPDAVTTTASLWSASALNGAFYSTNSGGTWTPAPGAGDYQLPAGGTWQTVKALGLNVASGNREVLIGNSSQGLFKTTNGGATWRNVSAPGSGLESTSRNVSTLLAVVNQFGATDVMVGVNGSSNGGVYLSGDAGEHWMQINQGFDPSSLNISTLAKTSCSGCPVQYYSGTYGSGVYTRTIAVVAAPVITGWCFGGTGCACGVAPGSGPELGGQPFRLCGTGFAALAKVEFDGVPATGCTFVSSSVYTCTATPPHFALGPGGSTVAIRLRNTDTRTGYASQPYTYSPNTSRVTDLRLSKTGLDGADAQLQWSCTGCNTTPARVYRSPTANFSLFENYNGGAGPAWTQTGALSGGSPTYFWRVE